MACVEVEFAGYKGRSCARGELVTAQARLTWTTALTRLSKLMSVGTERRFSDISEASRKRISTFAEATFEEIFSSIPDAGSYTMFIAYELVREIGLCTQRLASDPNSLYKRMRHSEIRALALQCVAYCYPNARGVAGLFSKSISEATGAEARALSEVKLLIQDSRTRALHADAGFQAFIEDVRLGVFELRERVGVLATLTRPLAEVNPHRLSASGFKLNADGIGVSPSLDVLSTFEFDPEAASYTITELSNSQKSAISNSWAQTQSEGISSLEDSQGATVELVFLMTLAYTLWSSETTCLQGPLAELELATAHISRAIAALNGDTTAKLDQDIAKLETLDSLYATCRRTPPELDCGFGGRANLFVRYLGLSAAIYGVVWSIQKIKGR
jgi:hypothetical protein